jgi:phosphatidylserine decarboxylase
LYKDSSNWKTLNQFFIRRFKSPDNRPVAAPNYACIVVSPTNTIPQGIWKIDGNSMMKEQRGVQIKTATICSVNSIIGNDSKFKDAFDNIKVILVFSNEDCMF